jgi:WD40 repeat protein
LLLAGLLAARAQDTLYSSSTGSTINRSAPWWDYDGQQILGAIDRTVYLWDANTGRIVRSFGGHGEFVDLAKFSPDGKYVLTVSYDQPADFEIPHPDSATRLWDRNTGKLIWRLEGEIYAHFSTDGTRLLTISLKSHNATLWNVPTGRKLVRVKGDTSEMAISQDNAFFVAGDNIYRAQDGTRIATSTLLFDYNMYGPHGDLAVGTLNGSFEIWNHLDGSKRTIQAAEGGPRGYGPAWTPDGAYVVSTIDTDRDRKAVCVTRIWTVATGKAIAPSPCPALADTLMVRPQHAQFLARWGELDAQLRNTHDAPVWGLFDIKDGHQLWQASLSEDVLGFAADGNTLLAFAHNTRINTPDRTRVTIFSAETGEPLRTLQLDQP